MNNNGMDKDDKEEKGGLTLEQFTDIVLAQVSKRRQTKSCTNQLRGLGSEESRFNTICYQCAMHYGKAVL